MDLDKVMDEVGQFGKFQGLCYFLLSFSIFYSAIAGIGYVFPTGMVNYRCRIPECEENDVKYAQDWLKNAVPYKDDMPSRCERYSPRNKTNPFDGILNNETVCTADLFDNTTRIPCEEYLFDDEEWLLVNEWKITSCTGKHWKQTLVGTINNVGQFIGFPLAGYFSDRYGRKATLMVSTLVTCVLGLLRSVAWNYEIFLFSEFLVAGFSGGIYNSGFVLGLELVGPKARVIGGAIISTFYSAGMVILAAVAWWSKNWRLMQAMYAPGLICIIYYWLLPESVRWLQSQGRNDEVKKIMKRAAKINGVQLSDQEFNKFELAPVVSEKPDEEKPAPARSKGEAFKKVFQSRILLARLVNCAFCWITNSFVYIGLSLSAVSIGGGKYTNFMLVAVVEIPAYAATPFFSDRFGRRLSLCVSLLIAGVCCVCFAFIPEDYDTAKLVVFLAGKFAITVAFTVVFVCTAELFPTELRHSMLGTCSMVGRVGSIIAPQTPLLAEIFKSLPFFLFGGMSVASGLLILMIPETLNQKLPDTVEEAENLGRKPQNT